MRILHVTDAYLPKQGGIEVQVRGLALRQAEAGHEVEVLTCAPPNGGRRGWAWTAGPRLRTTRDPDDAGRVLVYRVGVPWPHIPLSSARLHAFLSERRPDVVHVHLSVLSPLGILAARDAARTGVPVVVTLHSLWWWATGLYRAADRLLGWGRWPVQWTAVSALAAEPLHGIVPGQEVSVLPNGVDPLAWRDEPLPRRDDEVVVVSVMRLALRKRPRALLRVVRAARAGLPPSIRLRVIVIGEGPQRRSLERRIRRWRLTDCIELPGQLEHARIRELYRRADLYLAPAILESFGIAALEARSAGVPVVARRRTGIADFVEHGVNGLLADGDRGLAEAVVTLATSPALRASLARHNRALLPEHSWHEALQRADLAYKLAAEPSPAASRRR